MKKDSERKKKKKIVIEREKKESCLILVKNKRVRDLFFNKGVNIYIWKTNRKRKKNI